MRSRATLLALTALGAGILAALLGVLGSELGGDDAGEGSRMEPRPAAPAPDARGVLDAGSAAAEVEMVAPVESREEAQDRRESASATDGPGAGESEPGGGGGGAGPLAVEAAEDLRWVVRGAMRARNAFDGALATVSIGLAEGGESGVTGPANADGTFNVDVSELVARWQDGDLVVRVDHPEFLPATDEIRSPVSFGLDPWTGDKVVRTELYLRRPACILTGRVAGEAAATAEVALFEPSSSARGPFPVPVDTAKVRGGRYRLRAREPGEHYVAVWHDDRAVAFFTVAVPRQPELELAEVSFGDGANLAGFVQLPGGRGAAGCIVEARPVAGPLAYPLEWKGVVWDGAALVHGVRRTVVGQANDFAFTNLAEFPHHLVVTGVPGLTVGPDPEDGELVTPPDLNVLVVPPVCQTRFFVVSEEGRVKGATVEVAHELAVRSVMTDADGNAELALPAGTRVDVTVTCPGHFPRSLSLETTRPGMESIEPIKLVARSAATAVLVLRVEGDDPPSELLARWSDAGAEVEDRRRVRGDGGVFRMDGLPAGRLAFTVRPAGLASYALDASFTADLRESAESEASVRFREGGRLRLRLEGDARGDLVYSLSRSSPGKGRAPADLLFLPCDASGTPRGTPPFGGQGSARRFGSLAALPLQESFPNLEPGEYRLLVVCERSVQRELEIVAGETTEVALPLRETLAPR